MFLVKHGFSILGKNFSTIYGEIDLIIKKGKRIHFVEVKTCYVNSVSRVTFSANKDTYLPEENISSSKIGKLSKTAEVYLDENNLKDREVQIDAVSVLLTNDKRILNIKHIENINIK